MKRKYGPIWSEGEESVNKRCEYEVQATNGTEHDFPQIAQGMAKEEVKKLEEKRESWYHKPVEE